MRDKVILETNLPLPIFIKGKVRDTYDLGDNLLIVASDRISAFDVILPCGIPQKGRVLNLLSAFWFEKTKHIVPNHVVEIIDDVSVLDKYIPEDKRFDYPKWLEGRSMVVKKVDRISMECIVRGYISGSAWAEYRNSGTISGKDAPKCLQQSQILPKTIFTPSTKGEDGEHDLPMSDAEVIELVGKDMAQKLEEVSTAIYSYGRECAIKNGIVIADTKFEFGTKDGELILIDEALTPDSSRFWDINLYKVGQPQDSYDKQPVRDYLETLGWDKQPPAPMLPPEVIEQTSLRYRRAYERLSGKTL